MVWCHLCLKGVAASQVFQSLKNSKLGSLWISTIGSQAVKQWSSVCPNEWGLIKCKRTQSLAARGVWVYQVTWAVKCSRRNSAFVFPPPFTSCHLECFTLLYFRFSSFLLTFALLHLTHLHHLHPSYERFFRCSSFLGGICLPTIFAMLLRDSDIDSLNNQLATLSNENQSHHNKLQLVLEQFRNVLEDYSSLKSDYEEVKEGREKYKKQARGQVCY